MIYFGTKMMELPRGADGIIDFLLLLVVAIIGMIIALIGIVIVIPTIILQNILGFQLLPSIPFP